MAKSAEHIYRQSGQPHQAWLGRLPDEEVTVIAFRGTEGVAQDWLTDADIRREDNPWLDNNGRIHRGFLDSYQSIANEVLQGLTNLGHSGDIWLCGHSLGGALATLAAAHLRGAGFTIAGYAPLANRA